MLYCHTPASGNSSRKITECHELASLEVSVVAPRSTNTSPDGVLVPPKSNINEMCIDLWIKFAAKGDPCSRSVASGAPHRVNAPLLPSAPQSLTSLLFLDSRCEAPTTMQTANINVSTPAPSDIPVKTRVPRASRSVSPTQLCF